MTDLNGSGGAWTDLERPPLRVAALRRALTDPPAPVWRHLDVVAATTSTNADVAGLARAGEPEGYVLLADHQSAGRGRLARRWTAPARSSLAVSVLLRPGSPDQDGRAVPAHRWPWIGMIGGLALVDVLTRVAGLPAGLKWPNDVLVPETGRREDGGAHLKVSGILTEVVAAGGPGAAGDHAASAVVLGVGLNVSQEGAELPVPTATSLRLAGAATLDRDTLARAYLRALAERYRRWRVADGDPVRSGVGAAYRESCLTLGRRVRVDLPGDAALTGLAEQVDAAGRLVLRDDAGTAHSLAAGDAVHLRPDGRPGL